LYFAVNRFIVSNRSRFGVYFESGTDGSDDFGMTGVSDCVPCVSSTEDRSPVLLAKIAKLRLLSMKHAANIAVARDKRFAVPRTLTNPEPLLPPPPIPSPPPSLR
jgi:hypothetical protein